MAIFYKKHTNISPAWRAGEYMYNHTELHKSQLLKY